MGELRPAFGQQPLQFLECSRRLPAAGMSFASLRIISHFFASFCVGDSQTSAEEQALNVTRALPPVVSSARGSGYRTNYMT